MENQTLEVIKRRRSIRNFAPKQIQEEALAAILEAGQYAPHGGSEIWHFTAIQNAEVLERINSLAKKFALTSGMAWLENLGRSDAFHSLYHAPTVILVSGETDNVCAVSDTAAATENMMLAAESLGIGSCWGYFATQAFYTGEGTSFKKELGIPAGYTVYTSVMLGYKAEEPPAAAPRKPGTITYVR